MTDFGACETVGTERRIVLREKRSAIVFLNPRRARIRKIVIDGCVIKDGPRCDHLLIDAVPVEHFVELKGSNVRHALDQLEATIKQVSTDAETAAKRAYVISTRCPLASPAVQAHQRRFKRTYNAALIIRASGFEVDLSKP